MPGPVPLTLLALATAGVSDFLYKRAMTQGAEAGQFLMTQSACFLTAQLLCMLLFSGSDFTAGTIALGLVGGVLAFASFYCLLKGMERGDASVSSTIFRLAFVWTSGLAIVLLDEPVTFGRALGIACAVGAVVAMGKGSAVDKGRETTAAFSHYALVAFVALGTRRFLHRLAGCWQMSPPSLLLVQSAVFQCCAISAACLSGEPPWAGLNRPALCHGPVCGVLLAASAISLILAMRQADASVVVPAAQMSFLVTAPLSWVLLHEALNVRKIAGLCLATAAVVSFVAA